MSGRRRSGAHGLLQRAVRGYFELSYRVLATDAGRAFSELAVDGDAPPVHGYTTVSDVEALLRSLRPRRSDTVIDIGCGFGEVAIAVHRRTGSAVTGIDVAGTAIAEARRRAAIAGVDRSVRFEVSDLTGRLPKASGAYALDSLMFVSDPVPVLASLTHGLDAPRRVFVTYLDTRWFSEAPLRRALEQGGMRVESLEDVTPALVATSRRRSSAAVHVVRSRGIRGLGLALVLAEEAVVILLVRRWKLRRWRISVVSRAGSELANAT